MYAKNQKERKTMLFPHPKIVRSAASRKEDTIE